MGNFWQKCGQYRAQTAPPAKYKYLSHFSGILIGLTICVSAKDSSLISLKSAVSH
jgi:hypothetical protein